MRTACSTLDEVHVLIDPPPLGLVDINSLQIGIDQLNKTREGFTLDHIPGIKHQRAKREKTHTFPLKISPNVNSSYSSSTGPVAYAASGLGAGGKQFPIFFDFDRGMACPVGSTGEEDPEELGVERGEGTPGGKTSLRKKNFWVLTASRRCARAMFSSTCKI